MKSGRRAFLQATAAGTAALAAHPLLADPSREFPSQGNPYLEGDFAPVHEETTIESLQVVGRLPTDLCGMFVRNGPNPQFPPKGRYHWFDGDGMLHGVRIQDGKASYRNRYVQTVGYKAEKKAGKALWGGLLDPPDVAKFALGLPPFKNAANTALVWRQGKLLALWEGGEPYEVRVPSLETAAPYTFGGQLRHACTAHPKIDARTGEMMFFGYGPVRPYLHYSVAGADGKIVRTVPIELRRPVMMHDFAVSEKYTVFLDLPESFRFNPRAGGAISLTFEPKFGARIGVIARHGGPAELRWFAIDPCWVFHTLSAYDEGDEVVLVACRSKDFPHSLEQANPSNSIAQTSPETAPMLTRWRMNLKTGQVREERLDDLPAEFPRQRDDWMGRKADYAYLMTLAMDGLVKYDLKRGGRTMHSHGTGRFGGEGVFVPKRDGRDEDDGWVITYVVDAGSKTSEMIVVDAKDFASPPAARVIIPARIPFGFHALWISGDEIPTA
jgi:carotenoid cleavage dioxygenase